jgi:hypothetical protein
MTTFKNPPIFNQAWKLVTDLKSDKQALAVSLSLTGNAREVAMEVAAADLAKEDGMKTLIENLDKVFLRDDKDHWGKADDRNFNYSHPKMVDMKLGKNLFCQLNCFYNVF